GPSLLAALLGAALLPQLALAECITINDSLRAVMPYADIVFSGTVTEVVDLSGELDRFITFDVDRVWKGPVTKRFSIHGFDLPLGRYTFDVGRTYLVFAHKPRTDEERTLLRVLPSERETFVVGICGGGTRSLNEATQSKLTELGSGRTPR